MQTKTRIKESLNNLTALVIGDLMLDIYTYGTIDRISPEAPVPVFKVNNKKENLGGLGNVLSNLIGLGINVVPISIIGDDKYGGVIKSLLKKNNIDSSNILIKNNESTISKNRLLVDRFHQVCRVDIDTIKIREDDLDKIYDNFNKNINLVDYVIISDYGKGVCDKKLLTKIIKLSNEMGIYIYIDPKGSDYTKYYGSTCLTPNEKEAQKVVPFEINDKSVLKAAKWIRNEFNLDFSLITRGPKGMALSIKGKECLIDANAMIDVFDVSGAGDTVISVLSAFNQIGNDYETSALIAHHSGRYVVTKPGTYPINFDDLDFEKAPFLI